MGNPSSRTALPSALLTPPLTAGFAAHLIKNFYNVQAWLPKNMVMINLRAFNGLDKPTQEALLKAAATAEQRGWKLSQDKNAWYLDQLKARGMNIIEPSAALNADFRKMGDTMLADWLKKAGADGKAIVDAYRK